MQPFSLIKQLSWNVLLVFYISLNYVFRQLQKQWGWKELKTYNIALDSKLAMDEIPSMFSQNMSQGIASTRYSKKLEEAADKYMRAKWRAMASELPSSSRSREQWLLNFPVLLVSLQHNSFHLTCFRSKFNFCRRCNKRYKQ